jgi:hypothetical protein
MMVFPLAEEQEGNDPPVAIVFVHQPFRLRKVSFAANKQNTPPLIPAIADTDNQTMLNGHISFGVPTIQTGLATLLWKAQGEVTYIENQAWTLDEGYSLVDFPFDTTPQDLEAANASIGLGVEDFRTNPTFGERLANAVLSNYNEDSIYNDHVHYPSGFMSTAMAAVPTNEA